MDGRAPLDTTTPPIVEECAKKASSQLEGIARDTLTRDPNFIAEPGRELTLTVEAERATYEIVARPDLYVIYRLAGRPVNLIVEATLRSTRYTPIEPLVAEALAAYASNLLPTFIILLTPEETLATPLDWNGASRLLALINRKPGRKPTPQLCSNCDLRGVCSNPLV